jgi:hypothetical protein
MRSTLVSLLSTFMVHWILMGLACPGNFKADAQAKYASSNITFCLQVDVCWVWAKDPGGKRFLPHPLGAYELVIML